MDEYMERIHRTWLEFLVNTNMSEVAALAVDAELSPIVGNFQNDGFIINLPSVIASYLEANDSYWEKLTKTLQLVAKGHLTDQNGFPLENVEIQFRMKLADVDDDWRAVIREKIVNAKISNQGVVSDKVFTRKGKSVYEYNEMKFASQSEIRIAQEFELRKVLFFPLALAVRNDTGNLFKDHREVDFLVCKDGLWGILEVSFHPDRFEKDAEKDYWFKRSGILCIQHYTAERCYNESSNVVDEFLEVLSRFGLK